MGNCGSCGGNCAACSGCAGQLVLSAPEIDFLKKLGEIPFLPVARQLGDDTPVCPEPTGMSREDCTLVLQCLEKKGLISLDYDRPLKGYSTPEYDALPLRGSIALTARGIQMLELLEVQGFQTEE